MTLALPEAGNRSAMAAGRAKVFLPVRRVSNSSARIFRTLRLSYDRVKDKSLRLFQLKRVMNKLEGFGTVGFVDDATDFDFAGGDVLDVDLGVGQGVEHALGDAGVGAHAD